MAVGAGADAVDPGVEQLVELFQNQRYRKFKVSPWCACAARLRSKDAVRDSSSFVGPRQCSPYLSTMVAYRVVYRSVVLLLVLLYSWRLHPYVT